jgi:hypothetical protein
MSADAAKVDWRTINAQDYSGLRMYILSNPSA